MQKALRARAKFEGREYVSPFKAADEPPPLLEENEIPWELFEACQSQLIVAGLGVVVGVDHSTLPWKMDIRGIERDEQLDLEERFRLIEAVFVKCCNRRSRGAGEPKDERG